MARVGEVLHQIADFIREREGVFTPSHEPEEVTYYPPQYDLQAKTRLLEPEPHDISRRGSPIRYFNDGVQKTMLVGHLIHNNQHLSVHYSVVASIILKQVDGTFEVWDEPIVREYVLLPLKFLGETLGEPYVDTGAETAYFEQLRHDAIATSRRLRHQLEREHLQKWHKSVAPPDRIALDGTLWHLGQWDFKTRTVGLSKSFHPHFFNAEIQQKALRIGEGQRSFAFAFESPLGGEFASWFLRLRNPSGKDPEYGLLRVETGDANPGAAAIDEVSSAVYHLRHPVAYPMPKWDRILYPIRLCSEYLGNYIPKTRTVQYYFGWGVS